jgi:hypothetical protein
MNLTILDKGLQCFYFILTFLLFFYNMRKKRAIYIDLAGKWHEAMSGFKHGVKRVKKSFSSYELQESRSVKSFLTT